MPALQAGAVVGQLVAQLVVLVPGVQLPAPPRFEPPVPEPAVPPALEPAVPPALEPAEVEPAVPAPAVLDPEVPELPETVPAAPDNVARAAEKSRDRCSTLSVETYSDEPRLFTSHADAKRFELSLCGDECTDRSF